VVPVLLGGGCLPVEYGLEMYGEGEVEVPFFTGYLARGLLLHMIRRVDPSASSALHELNVRKGYSVTPLYFRRKRVTQRGYVMDESYPCRVRFRFLSDEYPRLLMRCFESDQTVLIYDRTFRIASVTVRSETYKQLWEESEPSEYIRLVFKTPTCFAALGQRYYCMFPEPKRVFGGLLSLWNLYANQLKLGEEKREEYLRWLGSQAGVSGFSLETRQVSNGETMSLGFMGWVAYRTQAHERWQKLTDCLARSAEYFNVGKNRTAGFGLIRYVEKRMVARDMSSSEATHAKD
jgi:CRISPR-associated endoribonuclease Cas6